MPAVDCCVQLIHSILCTVLWTKYLVIPAMKVSEWGHLLRALEIERVCH